VRIGLAVGAGPASVGGTGSVAASEPDGTRIATIPAGATWQIVVAGTRLILTNRSGWSSPPVDAITLAPLDRAAAVRVNGRSYRGLAEVLRDRTGLTLVNRLGLEAYLLGVVSAEMGRRSSTEEPALLAQAVVSRTYALRNLGRWRAQGFDLYATVADQVYGGVGAETPEGRAAVAATRGQIITYRGALIDALYYSTCGGRTADGYEVFRAAVRPYLRSVPDQGPAGAVYCSISPRYRWHEEWTGEMLRATLRRNLPEAGVTAGPVAEVSDVRITRRTSSGRVDQIAFALGQSEVRVDGTAVRRVLRPATGQLLKSSAFSLGVTGAGTSVSRLTADGMGAGHGVGLCQWGAVGRARAGQGFEQILAAYYPGTKLERRY